MTLKTCERCGKTLKSYFYETMCYKCQKEKNLEDITKSIFSGEVTETCCEDDVICPWCGEVIEGDCETKEFYEDGAHVFQCPECDKEFALSTSVSFSYSTERTLPSWILRERELTQQARIEKAKEENSCGEIAKLDTRRI